MSGLTPKPELEVSITVVRSATIPWGGNFTTFFENVPAPDEAPDESETAPETILRRRRHDDLNDSGSDETKSEATFHEEIAGTEELLPINIDENKNVNENNQGSKTNWALTYMSVDIRFGTVALHNNDERLPLSVGRYLTNDKRYENLYADNLRKLAPWQANLFNTRSRKGGFSEINVMNFHLEPSFAKRGGRVLKAILALNR